MDKELEKFIDTFSEDINKEIPFPYGNRKEISEGLQGWICPQCHRFLSPFTDYCSCKVEWKINC